MSKESKSKAWDEIWDPGKPPPTYEQWTDDDERELLEASKTNNTVDDTALGRVQMKKSKILIQEFRLGGVGSCCLLLPKGRALTV